MRAEYKIHELWNCECIISLALSWESILKEIIHGERFLSTLMSDKKYHLKNLSDLKPWLSNI